MVGGQGLLLRRVGVSTRGQGSWLGVKGHGWGQGSKLRVRSWLGVRVTGRDGGSWLGVRGHRNEG